MEKIYKTYSELLEISKLPKLPTNLFLSPSSQLKLVWSKSGSVAQSGIIIKLSGGRAALYYTFKSDLYRRTHLELLHNTGKEQHTNQQQAYLSASRVKRATR